MVLAFAILTLLFGSGTRQAPPAFVPYDASFTLPEPTPAYVGTTTFVVDAKGVVTGKMTITQPASVVATLAGTVKDGVWTFDYPFEMPARGCSGTVKGEAQVPADRRVISGSVTIAGACVEQPQHGTFSFTRQDKKN